MGQVVRKLTTRIKDEGHNNDHAEPKNQIDKLVSISNVSNVGASPPRLTAVDFRVLTRDGMMGI